MRPVSILNRIAKELGESGNKDVSSKVDKISDMLKNQKEELTGVDAAVMEIEGAEGIIREEYSTLKTAMEEIRLAECEIVESMDKMEKAKARKMKWVQACNDKKAKFMGLKGEGERSVEAAKKLLKSDKAEDKQLAGYYFAAKSIREQPEKK